MAAIVLLGVSTFCTDDGRLIFFNKLGIFLLMMSLLLKQFFDTSGWKLGKFLVSICQIVFASLGELGRPFLDFAGWRKGKETANGRKILYAALGLVIGVPIMLVVLLLLSSADALFRQMMERIFVNIRLGNIMNVLLRISFLFFASYSLTAYLCKHRISEKVQDRRKGEPVLAITVTGLLTFLYLMFSGIQIGALFLGQMQLPEGYTYAMYAREGFFQLLAVSLLNLVIVLLCLDFFRESRVLKIILTLMSLCTFVMIASSAMRMVIYIRFYYLTFLRILVLWALAVLALLFAGVVVSIFREDFPLFRYSAAVVTVLYLALSFAHPDYLIARVNISNAPHVETAESAYEETAGTEDFSRTELFGSKEGFFLASGRYNDFRYLTRLSADAAPALVPYLRELGYDMDAFRADSPIRYAMDHMGDDYEPLSAEGFGYPWMERIQNRTENMGLRSFNVSRYRAVRSLQK